ncbi:hypothetical protein SO802_008525 [Lithocarpus litseifolius]|uniref:Secreted protein n=1 Tax=Lithocarpus litseifolius TaxID=425828 RepID=A0AAW2D8Z0_9ROSI
MKMQFQQGFQLQLSEQIGAINLLRILWLQLTAIFLHGSCTVRRRLLKECGVRVFFPRTSCRSLFVSTCTWQPLHQVLVHGRRSLSAAMAEVLSAWMYRDL